MNLLIENVTATEQIENFTIIEKCVNAIKDIKTLDKAFIKIENELNNIVFWKTGRGGGHIWVSNWKNERLLLITE
tara:strand:- start:2912 stop:3136 length:225 start_codon:yes stop_codon:yes gene_type:complete